MKKRRRPPEAPPAVSQTASPSSAGAEVVFGAAEEVGPTQGTHGVAGAVDCAGPARVMGGPGCHDDGVVAESPPPRPPLDGPGSILEPSGTVPAQPVFTLPKPPPPEAGLPRPGDPQEHPRGGEGQR